METAISQGAKVVVLDLVNGAGAGGMVQSAQASDAKVIAYDRFIEGVDYYMSFDNETVGKMQADALVKDVGGKGNILMLNGAPSDPNAAQFKSGAHSVLDSSGVKILEEYDNPDWSPENAQQWTTDQLGKYQPAEIKGVYAANDGQAGGVVAALTGAGVAEDALPPITGQDAEPGRDPADRRGPAGHDDLQADPDRGRDGRRGRGQARRGRGRRLDQRHRHRADGLRGREVVHLHPDRRHQDNVADTIVKDNFYSVEDICTSDFASACEAAGLS